MVRNMPALDRFLGTALASLIGGFLLSYQWRYLAAPLLVKAAPASPEMMQLLRDEHRQIVDYARIANRK